MRVTSALAASLELFFFRRDFFLPCLLAVHLVTGLVFIPCFGFIPHHCVLGNVLSRFLTIDTIPSFTCMRAMTLDSTLDLAPHLAISIAPTQHHKQALGNTLPPFTSEHLTDFATSSTFNMLESHYQTLPLEVAVFSGDSILKAQSQGASRVELNAPGSYVNGGTTPSVSELARVADRVTIPVRIMIRPRGPPPSDAASTQDFIYSESELAEMAQSIRDFKATGLLNPLRGDGFVFGILKKSSAVDDSFTSSFGESDSDRLDVDVDQCKNLIKLARPFGCVFHRAFDPIAATRRFSEGVETLLDLGFEGLLTAGGYGNAIDNVDKIDHLCHRLAGRIQIVVGGGLRAANIADPASQLAVYDEGSVWMHTAALTERPDHLAEEIDSDELVRMVAQLSSVSPA